MQGNDLLQNEFGIYRILTIETNKVLAIDCKKMNMPKFYPNTYFENAEIVESLPVDYIPYDRLSTADRKTAHLRYTMIAGAVAVVDDFHKRNVMIEASANNFKISKQTIRSYLCVYLIYQDISALAPKHYKVKKELTADQKIVRWALYKFFYTRNQNSLPTAYTMMLKAKYCDSTGNLMPNYPTYNQFRYFYRKSRKVETFYISRDGLKNYQRNNRPLLGDGVQEFAPNIGTAMLDGTICDIYLVDETGQLVGRPILIVACDANTSLCMGYTLLWEGGTYSLQNLMLNILEDKVALCRKMGIRITPAQWPVNQLPGVMVTDGGSEYKGQTFEQITELGITLINLPSYRPDLKGTVEKFFDLIQSSYKDLLKGKGVIMPDFQERGSHDYRKDAVMTLQEFEKIVVRCIVYYNCERILKNYPYTKEMIDTGVLPYANDIWNYKKNEAGSNLIDVSPRDLVLTLLPRTSAKFTRVGLKVNNLRYYADGFKEQFLAGGECVVAYNPDNCNSVWLVKKDGTFVEFSLIQTRFTDMSFDSVKQIQKKQKELVRDLTEDNYQAKIELMSFIETVSAKEQVETKIKGVRTARQSAVRKNHKDIGGVIGE